MLQRKFRTWKILVVLTFIPVFIIKFFTLPQFIAETIFSISLMFGLLVFIHGIHIVCLIVKSDDKKQKLYNVLNDLENIEE